MSRSRSTTATAFAADSFCSIPVKLGTTTCSRIGNSRKGPELPAPWCSPPHAVHRYSLVKEPSPPTSTSASLAAAPRTADRPGIAWHSSDSPPSRAQPPVASRPLLFGFRYPSKPHTPADGLAGRIARVQGRLRRAVLPPQWASLRARLDEGQAHSHKFACSVTPNPSQRSRSAACTVGPWPREGCACPEIAIR